jgi:sporulation integral membrane protein YtvI
MIIFSVLSFIIFKQSIIIILPFFFGYLISKLFIPILSTSKIKNKHILMLFTFILILIFISLISGIIFFIGRSFVDFLSTRVINNDAFRTQTLYYYNQLISNSINIPFDLPIDIETILDNTAQGIVTFLVDQSQKIVENSLRFIVFLPEILVFIIITFISAFFFTKDYELINRYKIKYIQPYIDKIKENQYYEIIVKDVFFVLFGYLKAQLILMSFTFVIATFALGLLRIEKFIFKAFAISFIDALPIFGTAIILIPWAIFSLISDKVFLGTALFILYLTITIFRQSIEPKIFSTQIGLYPLATLFSIYAGLKILGILGIFIGPILIIITKTLIKHKKHEH